MTGAPPKPSDCNERLPGAPVIGISDWLGRIVCGDNTEVLSGFPAECVDLVVTSPPYDDLRTYGGHSWNFETLAAQLVRVLKPGGVIVWVVGDKTEDGCEKLTPMRQAIQFRDVIGLNVWDTMIWQKTSMPGDGKYRYHNVWEYMLVLSKGTPKTINIIRDQKQSAAGQVDKKQTERRRHNGEGGHMRERKPWVRPEMRCRDNVWRIHVGSGQATKEQGGDLSHPAYFPERLAKDHIVSWSSPGDVVLDPFVGSGTTCKAAKELNRQWCGIEINPEYCAIADKRMTQEVLNLS